MSTIADASVVVPYTVVQCIILFLGLSIKGFLLKDQIFKCAEDETATINSVSESNSAEQPATIGGRSPPCGISTWVHFMAVLSYASFLVFCLATLFTTNYLYENRSCRATIAVIGLAFVANKVGQYGFFIMRLRVVFDNTVFQVEPPTIRKLAAAVALFAISQTAVMIYFAADNDVYTFPTHPHLNMCNPPESSFDPVVVVFAVLFVLCDGYVLITSVQLFTGRLAQMGGKSFAEARNSLAFHLNMVFIVVEIMSWLLGAVVMMYPHNLAFFVAPAVNMVISLVTIGFDLKNLFGEHMWILNKEWELEHQEATATRSEM